jgi:asparagine synthase (glutamine-hydrolysing)
VCGIVGIVGASASYEVDASTIRRMCGTIAHRGPDDEGVFVKSGVGLGNRRLSVIDVVGGRQPISNEDASVWVVFNGEIYNFRELRAELEASGHRFSTGTDTEVIVHLYEDIGRDCVQRLRGMFAFALYDLRQRKVLIARDRMGEKPLHYAFDGTRLVFGSEIKAIHAADPALTQIDSSAMRQYLFFGYVPDPGTAFVSIRKLPPGHFLELKDGKLSVSQYWDLPEYGVPTPAPENELLEQLEARLAEAVRMRLASDVPLGAFLSGGCDSSTIVALMARFSSGTVKTFSVGFRQKDFDETPHARIVAKKFATDHHELILEPDVLSSIETLTHSLEEPFGDSSALPTYFVSCLARQHVTVALSGDGGDELFAGYDRYRVCLKSRSLNSIPSALKRFYRERVYNLIPRSVPGRRLSFSLSLPWQERYLYEISLRAGHKEMSLFADDFIVPSANERHPFDLFHEYLKTAPALDPLGRILYLDSKTYLPADILTKVDRMSMLASLEVRAPMLDHVLVEWVVSLPQEWKMRGSYLKYLLRRLAMRLGVPGQALDRPKQGFALPLVHWTHELKDLILQLLLEPRTLQRGYLNSAGIHKLLDEHFRGRRNHAGTIWRLLMLELWQRNYVEKLRERDA